MSEHALPRVLISIHNGIPFVVAVDGTVQVIIADFDRDGVRGMTKAEVDTLFSEDPYTGGTHAFDLSVDFEKELLLAECSDD